MTGHGAKYDRKKEQAIAALLTQRNVEEAAKIVGVEPKTLYRWMKLPEFDSEYREAKRAAPMFKQYREADGRFHFKLVDGERVLLLSRGFESPKDAGARLAALRRDGFAGADADIVPGEGVDAAEVRAALDALRAADEAKA